MNQFSRSFLKILIAFAVIAVILLVTYSYWYPRAAGMYLLWKIRSIEINPVTIYEKSLESVTAPTGALYKHDALQFRTPWSSVEERKEGDGYLALFFVGEKSVLIFDSPSLYDEVYGSIIEQDPQYEAVITENWNDNYSLYRGMLLESKENLKPITAPADFYQHLVIALLKGTVVPDAWDTAYEFENENGIRGFVFVTDTTRSLTSIFTPDDRSYNITITGTTEEIDSILKSLEPIATE
jgi:hypothetical protein